MRLRKPVRVTDDQREGAPTEWVPEPGLFKDSSLDLMRGLDVEELAMDELPDVRWEPLA